MLDELLINCRIVFRSFKFIDLFSYVKVHFVQESFAPKKVRGISSQFSSRYQSSWKWMVSLSQVPLFPLYWVIKSLITPRCIFFTLAFFIEMRFASIFKISLAALEIIRKQNKRL